MAIVLVYGPPCGGKTTHVLTHAAPDDLIVDHDLLAQDAGSDRTHNHYSEYRDAAEAEVDRLLDEVADGKHPNAWIIRTAPDTQRRAELARYIRASEAILITAPRDVLIARAQDRDDPVATVRAINRWHEVAERKSVRQHPAWRRRPD